jgi:TBC1 domain family member 13
VKTKEKVVNFLKILNKRKIQITMLRSLSFRGIPEQPKILRMIVWKVLIGYLPTETHKWETHIKAQKAIYDQWENELIIKPKLRVNSDCITAEMTDQFRQGVV